MKLSLHINKLNWMFDLFLGGANKLFFSIEVFHFCFERNFESQLIFARYRSPIILLYASDRVWVLVKTNLG